MDFLKNISIMKVFFLGCVAAFFYSLYKLFTSLKNIFPYLLILTISFIFIPKMFITIGSLGFSVGAQCFIFTFIITIIIILLLFQMTQNYYRNKPIDKNNNVKKY